MDEITNKISNLFKKYGIKSITMDDIANKEGVEYLEKQFNKLKI